MSLVLDPKSVGYGWRELANNELIQTLDQYLHHEYGMWRVSTAFTSEDRKKPANVNYRRPVLSVAKREAIWAAKGKLVRGLWEWLSS